MPPDRVSCVLVLLALLLTGCGGPDQVFFVINAADVSDALPGDGRCEAIGTDGTTTQPCTLRAAFEEINALPSGREYRVELQASQWIYRITPEISSQLTVDGADMVVGGQYGMQLFGDREVSLVYRRATDGPERARIELASGSKGRLFTVRGAQLAISDVEISGGDLTPPNGDRTLFNGGAISVDQAGSLTLVNCVLQDNKAPYGGGAIALQSDTVSGESAYSASDPRLDRAIVITGTLFRDNAALNGGAIIATNRKLTVEGVNFVNNSAYGEGGAVNLHLPVRPIRFAKTQFNWNYAQGGGAIFVSVGRSQDLTIENTIFAGNEAFRSSTSAAGASVLDISPVDIVDFSVPEGPPVRIIHSTVFRNFAMGRAAISNNTAGRVVLDSTLMVENYSGTLRHAGGVQSALPPRQTEPMAGVDFHEADRHLSGRFLLRNKVYISGNLNLGINSILLEDGAANQTDDPPQPFGSLVAAQRVWQSFGTLFGNHWQLDANSVAVDAIESCRQTPVDAFDRQRPRNGNPDTRAACDIGASER